MPWLWISMEAISYLAGDHRHDWEALSGNLRWANVLALALPQGTYCAFHLCYHNSPVLLEVAIVRAYMRWFAECPRLSISAGISSKKTQYHDHHHCSRESESSESESRKIAKFFRTRPRKASLYVFLCLYFTNVLSSCPSRYNGLPHQCPSPSSVQSVASFCI